MHLLALLGLFTDWSDRFPCLKKVPLPGGASPSRPLKGVYPQTPFACPPPPPTTTTTTIRESFHLQLNRCITKCLGTKIYKQNCIIFLFFIDQQNGIPLPVTPKKPWSIDANLMHIRCGDLTLYAPVFKYKFSKLNLSIFLTTRTFAWWRHFTTTTRMHFSLFFPCANQG